MKDREEETKEIKADAVIQKGLNQIGLGSTKGEIDQHHIENLPPRILFENLTEILIDMKYNFGSIDTTTGKINSSADQEAKDKGSMVSVATPSGERNFEILDVEYV